MSDTDVIRMACPFCETRLRLKAGAGGKRVVCPKCRGTFSVRPRGATEPTGEAGPEGSARRVPWPWLAGGVAALVLLLGLGSWALWPRGMVVAVAPASDVPPTIEDARGQPANQTEAQTQREQGSTNGTPARKPTGPQGYLTSLFAKGDVFCVSMIDVPVPERHLPAVTDVVESHYSSRPLPRESPKRIYVLLSALRAVKATPRSLELEFRKSELTQKQVLQEMGLPQTTLKGMLSVNEGGTPIHDPAVTLSSVVPVDRHNISGNTPIVDIIWYRTQLRDKGVLSTGARIPSSVPVRWLRYGPFDIGASGEDGDASPVCGIRIDCGRFLDSYKPEP